MNPQQPQKRSGFSLSGGKNRILILIGGGIVILGVGIILVSLLFGGNGENSQKLLGIAQTQTELIRLAEQAKGKARTSAAVNLATTVSATVTSSENQTLPIVKRSGAKTDVKTLALKRTAKTDQQLASAEQSSQYDTVFITVMTTQLQSYQTQLKDAYASLKKPTDKQVMKSAYDSTTLILKSQSAN